MNQARRATATVQSIERAVAIMRCFTEAEPELSVTELSARLSLHKSTVSRILATLQGEGLVSQNHVNGKYRLGIGLISLAGVALGRVDVRRAGYYHLDELVETTQETVNLTILEGGDCVSVESKPSPRQVRYVSWIGRRMPPYCTASGKVLLAGLSPEERRNRLTFPLRPYTEYTIVDPAALESELECVRGQGYAIAEEEFELGFSAVAAPLHDHAGQVVGAVSASGPSFRLPKEQLTAFVPALLQTAEAISAEMGYTGRKA